MICACSEHPNARTSIASSTNSIPVTRWAKNYRAAFRNLHTKSSSLRIPRHNLRTTSTIICAQSLIRLAELPSTTAPAVMSENAAPPNGDSILQLPLDLQQTIVSVAVESLRVERLRIHSFSNEQLRDCQNLRSYCHLMAVCPGCAETLHACTIACLGAGPV